MMKRVRMELRKLEADINLLNQFRLATADVDFHNSKRRELMHKEQIIAPQKRLPILTIYKTRHGRPYRHHPPLLHIIQQRLVAGERVGNYDAVGFSAVRHGPRISSGAEVEPLHDAKTVAGSDVALQKNLVVMEIAIADSIIGQYRVSAIQRV